MWKKAIVRVAFEGGPRDVEAVAYGPLAIFKSPEMPWRVVHVPSGLRVCSVFVEPSGRRHHPPGRRPSLAVLKKRVEWSLCYQADIWEALASLPFNPSAGVMSGAHKAALQKMNSNPPRVNIFD